MKVMTTLTSERRINDAEQKTDPRAIWVEHESDERSDQNEKENINKQISVRENSTYSAPPPSLIGIEKPTAPELLSQVATIEQMEEQEEEAEERATNRRRSSSEVRIAERHNQGQFK
jgi:hypothetical protein